MVLLVGINVLGAPPQTHSLHLFEDLLQVLISPKRCGARFSLKNAQNAFGLRRLRMLQTLSGPFPADQ